MRADAARMASAKPGTSRVTTARANLGLVVQGSPQRAVRADVPRSRV
jgi:hypothetical protein